MEVSFDQLIDEVSIFIDEYAQIVPIILKWYEDINIQKQASAAINFRDALNHFAKMYEAYNSKDEFEFVSQYSSIYEHLHRGIKDSVIYLLSEIANRLHSMLNNTQFINHETAFRKYLHYYANTVMDVRCGSISIDRIVNEDLLDSINDEYTLLKKYLEDNQLDKIFLRRLSPRY